VPHAPRLVEIHQQQLFGLLAAIPQFCTILGRFGVNLVTGWQKPEYEQMGLWPGDEYFSKRYDYLTEYVTVLRDLWGTGRSDFKGDYFTMNLLYLHSLSVHLESV
jgi:hypothetical protein